MSVMREQMFLYMICLHVSIHIDLWSPFEEKTTSDKIAGTFISYHSTSSVLGYTFLIRTDKLWDQTNIII